MPRKLPLIRSSRCDQNLTYLTSNYINKNIPFHAGSKAEVIRSTSLSTYAGFGKSEEFKQSEEY